MTRDEEQPVRDGPAPEATPVERLVALEREELAVRLELRALEVARATEEEALARLTQEAERLEAALARDPP